VFGLAGHSDADLSPLGVTELTEGEHVFRLRLQARRGHQDHHWSLWFDGSCSSACRSGRFLSPSRDRERMVAAWEERRTFGGQPGANTVEGRRDLGSRSRSARRPATPAPPPAPDAWAPTATT